MVYSDLSGKEQSFKEPESSNWFRFFYAYIILSIKCMFVILLAAEWYIFYLCIRHLVKPNI